MMVELLLTHESQALCGRQIELLCEDFLCGDGCIIVDFISFDSWFRMSLLIIHHLSTSEMVTVIERERESARC